jgi:hypothetical protein
MKKIILNQGERFGKLVIIEETKTSDNHRAYLCKCDCGVLRIIPPSRLVFGNTLSCGCYGREIHTKHGLSKTPLYAVWKLMCKRCYDKTNKDFYLYGERDIKIFIEWKNDFKAFYSWAINNGWKKGLQIDRINNNGDYEPTNCRWVTSKVQSNNTRRNILVTYERKQYTLSQLCEKLNMNYSTIYYRITGMKMDIIEAIKKPSRYKISKVNH